MIVRSYLLPLPIFIGKNKNKKENLLFFFSPKTSQDVQANGANKEDTSCLLIGGRVSAVRLSVTDNVKYDVI